MRVCEMGETAEISAEAMRDLDVFRLCRTFFPAKIAREDAEIEAFINTYITSDVHEIERRCEIIEGLRRRAESAGELSLLVLELERMADALDEMRRASRPLRAYTQMLYALEAYCASAALAESLFSHTNSPAMAEIADAVRAQMDSPFHKEVEERLRRVKSRTQTLRSVTLAVNVSESGQAAQIGVTDVNMREGAPKGIFGGAEGDVNSLCDASPVKTRNQLVHLEEYVLSQVEKQWASPLNAALRLLKKVDYGKIAAWHDQLRKIELYYVGLTLIEKLSAKGIAARMPKPCADQAYAKDMRYPHMALNGLEPLPQSFGFSAGDTVLITGANSSGKTSALKAFAQNCILAQLGFPVMAEEFAFIPFRHWATVFSAGEDGDLSRYQREVERMRLAMNACDAHSCLLFNEPFTSTNPAEASELLCELLLQLRDKGATVVVVTHIFELYERLLAAGARLRSYVTGIRHENGEIVHTRVLEEKAPDGLSHAGILAREYGLTMENLIPDPALRTELERFSWGGDGLA